MNPRFRNYPEDDWRDQVIGYWHTGNVDEATPKAMPSLTPGVRGGTHASYILAMAREGGEFTVKELTTRFGLAHQGANFYSVLQSLVDARLIERRIGKNNTAYLRGTERVR